MNKTEKEKTEIYFEANEGQNNNDLNEAKLNFAFVIHGNIKQIAILDDFLNANHYTVRFRKISPKFLKVMESEQQ